MNECNLGTNRTYQQVEGGFLPGLTAYYQQPSAFRVAPFRIFGNLYYVGDRKVCSHLLDTGDGLILFDSGYRHALHLLLGSIRELGFAPEDVRYVIHSHEHFDHFGGGNELRALYGCKILMSRAGTSLLREDPKRSLLHYSAQPSDGICWPDKEIDDGDRICLGNACVRCVSTPGHTGGTMTFFFDAIDGDKRLKVGYMGGVGFLSIYREYCRQYGLPQDMCEQLALSIRKVWPEEVDIVLGNHPNHNCTLEKREQMVKDPSHNPFINPEAWHIFLTALDERRKDFESRGY